MRQKNNNNLVFFLTLVFGTLATANLYINLKNSNKIDKLLNTRQQFASGESCDRDINIF